MARQEKIVLWIDRRWKDAIEKHLRDETLEEHLEDVLDELCNQLPEREYKRISAKIYAEDAARRTEEEAARTYAAYHVTERGQEWYFKTSLGEELLAVGKKLRGYLTKGNGVAPDKFIGMFFGGQPITVEEYNALTALRMENTGKVRGVFDVNFDKREFKDYILAQKTAIDALRFDPKDSELNMYAILAMGFQGNLSMAQTYYTAAKPYLALEHAEVIKKYLHIK